MTAPAVRLWHWLFPLLAVAGYAGLSHWMMLYHAAQPWALLVLLGPLLLAVSGMCISRFGVWACLPVVLLGAALLAAVSNGAPAGANRLYLLQHVGINLLLGTWFGSTLRGLPLTLIGQLAQRLHRHLTPDMVAYTYKVTAVWTVYFFAVSTGSVIVYASLPFSTWSFMSNFLAPMSVGCLFVGEHLVRYRLHPEFERISMADAVKAFQANADNRKAP